MRWRRRLRTVPIWVLIMVVPLSTVGATAPGAVNSYVDADKIDPFVLRQLKNQGQADIFVKMRSDAVLDAAEGIDDRVGRVQFVYDTLTSNAESSQQPIRGYLDDVGARYRSFWINNSLFVLAADLPLVESLAQRDDVAYVRGNHRVPWDRPVARTAAQDQVTAIEPGIEKISAPDVWATGNTGQGIVVASIDTGVRYTHEALVAQYRGNNHDGTFTHDYNWFDPTGTFPTQPGDDAGHGTHTMGTMVGGDGPGPLTNDIGVAPGAEWISAKGCGLIFCSDAALIASAQWIACPTRVNGTDPDCSKAPNVVNNSWGGGSGDPWYQSFVISWILAGIVPIFSIGNSGSSCLTAGSPGDYGLVIGVGAIDNDDQLASFSSKGPGTFRLLKPDFVAPGVSVRSSGNASDNAYIAFSGTSMAAPHVTGTIALIKSAESSTGLIIAYTALAVTAGRNLSSPPGPTSCGGRNYDQYPNFIYGWGRIDAAAAVNLVAP